MNTSNDIQFQLSPQRRSRRKTQPKPPAPRPVPRLTRLLALALKFERLLADGVVRDYADLARLGRVTRARMTQVMRLLDLAPEIQEEILFDQPPLTEREVRPVVREVEWERQRESWRRVLSRRE